MYKKIMTYEGNALSLIGGIAETQQGLLQAPIRIKDRQDQLADIKGAAHEFEAYFISNLLKVMRETVPKGALENKGGAYFYSFYDQEIGRLASQAGGLGLARIIQEYTEKMLPLSSFQNRQPIL
jgi:flagellar protein FlgJ